MSETVGTKRPHYLSKIPEERRQWPRRHAQLLAFVVFPKRGVKQWTAVQARIENISEGGVAITSRALEAIPDHFYIGFGKFEIMIPSAKVRIANDVMHVKFGVDQPTPFVDMLATIRKPLALMSPIAGGEYKYLLRHTPCVVAAGGAEKRKQEEKAMPVG